MGPDDRQKINVLDPTWSAIGKIEIFFQNRSVEKFVACTGTLVGRSIVLTAAHCVGPEEPTHIKFQPAYINGSVLRDPAIPIEIYRGNRGQIIPGSLDDWALLVLDKPLGDKYGYMSVTALSANQLASYRERIALAGYSADLSLSEIAYVDPACSVKMRWFKNLFSHDCDSAGNTSGAALIAGEASRRTIIGIHTGQDEWDANYGVPSQAFLPQLQLLQAREKSRSLARTHRAPSIDPDQPQITY